MDCFIETYYDKLIDFCKEKLYKDEMLRRLVKDKFDRRLLTNDQVMYYQMMILRLEKEKLYCYFLLHR